MNNVTAYEELSAASLYDAAQSEAVWPADRRIIYCNVTGSPWGMVTEEYVRHFMKNYLYSGRVFNKDLFIDRMTLFGGPSPAWQSKTPDMLVTNQHADPEGFLVYLLNWVLQLERAAMEIKKNDIESYITWRRSMIALRQALTQIDRDFIHKINDTILLMTGDGLFPLPEYLPARELPPYSNRDTLNRLMETCKKYYDRYKGRYTLLPGNKFPTQTRHAIHRKTFLKTYSAEDLKQSEEDALISIIVDDLFKEFDSRFDEKEHANAKKKTGIASGGFAVLKDMEKNATQIKPVISVIQPGEKLKFSFGKKNQDHVND